MEGLSYLRLARRWVLALFGTLALALIFLTLSAGTARADGVGNTDTAVNGCMGDARGAAVGCTANDVRIGGVAVDEDGDPLVTITDDGCAFPGDTVTFDATFEVVTTATERYDIGLWFATDGDPNGDGAKTGLCTAGTPAYAPDPPWLDLDNVCATSGSQAGSCVINGAPTGVACTTDVECQDPDITDPPTTLDTCGDIGTKEHADGIVYNPIFPVMKSITAECVAGPDGNLALPNCTSWRVSGANELCTSPLDAFPSQSSKCNCDEAATVPIRIPGFITVDKVTLAGDSSADPGNPTEFDFDLEGPTNGDPVPNVPAEFTLKDADDPFVSPPLDTTDEDGNVVGPYQVTETVTTGWELVSASCTRGDGTTFDYTNGGDIQPLPGETVACTFTNKQTEGTLTLVKTVVNDNGGTAVVGDFPLFMGATEVTSGQTVTFNAGTQITASETEQDGYAASDWGGHCAADGTVTIEAGVDKTCTITNDDIQPKLTLVKTVINDNGGTLQVANFPLFVDATSVNSGDTNGFNAGTYTASETEQDGYAASDWGGDCAANGSVTLAAGDDKTCTITNDDIQPKLTLIKTVINDNGGTLQVANFPLFVDATSVNSGDTNGFNAGTYTASETEQDGYAASDWGGDCAANGSVTLAAGDDKTCTITNDDIQPKLTLIKTVINDNGGTLQVANFPLFVDATSVNSGDTNGFNAGTYTASETEQDGYAASDWGGDCAANGSVTLAAGDDKTCTITNNDIQPKLTLIKTVINDNGGTLQVANFPLFVDATSVNSGDTNGFNAGTYTASETEQDGYAASDWGGDCAANGSVTLAAGDDKTCTITNNDIQPKLTLIKTVINDNGGTLQVANFPLFVDATSVNSGDTNGFNAGTYTASETEQDGYAASDWGGDCAANGSVTLAAGDDKTCTITNDDIQPKLTLVKTVINDNGGTLQVANFPLFVDATSVNSGDTNGFNAGTYTASETEQDGYAASDWGGDCAANGSVTLAAGDDKTCTITNDDIQPKLTLVKTVINDNGGTLQVANFPLFVDATSVNSGDTNGFNAGTYTASETEQDGYAASDWGGDCAANGSVTLAAGDDKTCTITNDDIQPKLTLVKTVINDNGGTLQVANFPLFVDATSVNSGDTNGFNAGTYTASETEQDGYAASDWGGDCAANGSVTLAAGDDKTCTITNDDIQPKLTLVKTVINDNGGTLQVANFPLFVDATSVNSGDTNGFNAGTYTASETEQDGYAASDWGGDCAANGSVTLAAGDDKTCTITNDDIQPKLTLIKTVINDNGGTLQVANFPLFVDATSVNSGDTNGFNAGTYTASETEQDGYAASDWGGDCAANGSVTLAAGDDKTCTITNNDIQPKLTLIKTVINDNGGTLQVANFPLFVDATSVNSGDTNGFNAGTYTASETEQDGYAASDWGGDCAANGSVTLAAGDDKTCTITNNDIQPKLTLIKTVINDNGGTLQVANFPLFVDATSVNSGDTNGFNAGTYTASETEQDGYAASDWGGDCAANGSVTLAAGDDKTCTITNDDIQPKLTLVKTVINDNGGTLQVANFPLFVDATSVNSGDTNGFNAGTYTASETEQDGYAASDWGGDCAANGSVTLAAGDDKTCTITNNDIQPKLTLIKTVINDNGGTLQVANFPLFVDATSVNSGDTNGFNAGTYTASETEQDGYAASDWGGDCAANGSVTLAAGDDKTCTITNNDIQPKLTLIKTVINDNGGTLQVANFPLFVDATSVNSGDTNGFNAGTYTASETEQDGYAASDWGGDCAANGSVTLAAGDDKTCTITNNDIQPKLTLIKTVINDNGGTLQVANFPLFVDATSVNSGDTNGFNAGTYTASETEQDGYAASDWGGDCAANGSVTLAAGDDKTCTITNNDIQPKLTLIKTVINDNGGTLQVANFPLFVDATSVNSGDTNGFNAGTYTASETEQDGYAASDWGGDCAANGSVTLAAGDDKTCTITNNDIQPKLTLIKTVINDNGGTLQVANFPLFVDATSVNSGDTNGFNAGTYTASETEQDGYAASDWGGDCAANGSVTLAAGDDKTCTITNNDIQPKLTVIKTVINDDGGTAVAGDFTMNVSGTDVSPASFAGAEDPGTMVTLDAGDYAVTEINPFPNFYAVSFSADCEGSIGVGEEKTCTVTNDDVAGEGPSIIVTAKPFSLDGTSLTGSALIEKDGDVDDPSILATSFQVIFEYKLNGKNGGWFPIGATCTYDPAAPVEFAEEILVGYSCTLAQAVPENAKSARVTFEVNIFGRDKVFSDRTDKQA